MYEEGERTNHLVSAYDVPSTMSRVSHVFSIYLTEQILVRMKEF